MSLEWGRLETNIESDTPDDATLLRWIDDLLNGNFTRDDSNNNAPRRVQSLQSFAHYLVQLCERTR